MEQAQYDTSAPRVSFAATASGVYLLSINALFSNIQPLLLGALAGAYGLKTGQLGNFTAAFVGASALSNLSSPLWIERVNWRFTSMAAVIGSALLLVSASTLTSPALLPVLFAMIGVCNGLISSPSFASLGQAKNPERAYGAVTTGQSVCVAAVSAGISNLVIPTFGLSGFLLTLAAIMLTGFLASWFLPATGSRPKARSGGAKEANLLSKAAVPAFVSLAGLFLFLFGVFLYYYFIERIGHDRGIPIGVIGAILSAAALSSLPTSLVVTVWGGRVPAITLLIWGSVVLVACCLVLALDGLVPYAGSVLLFGLGYGLTQPSYWAVLRNSDLTNRLFVAAPAALGAAGVSASLCAGPITERYGFAGLETSSAAMTISGAALSWIAVQLHARLNGKV